MHLRRIHNGHFGIQVSPKIQLLQELRIQLLPETRFRALFQTHSRLFSAAARFYGDILPATADRQHKPDHTEHRAVVNSRPTSLTNGLQLLRQQVDHTMKVLVRQW